jgi:hypothetical protein
MKNETKREKLSADNGIKSNDEEPILYSIFSNYLSKNKKAAPKKEDRA